MNPRSLGPLWRMPRSSRRSTVWANVACPTAKARWCTAPTSVDVRAGSGRRSWLVNTVISRPSPGSKYRWLSAALSRLGCSNTNGMPSTPSQKSIDVCRSAPTIVMWWTPWLWSLRIRRDATGASGGELVHHLRQVPPRIWRREEAAPSWAAHGAELFELGRDLGDLRRALHDLVVVLCGAPQRQGEDHSAEACDQHCCHFEDERHRPRPANAVASRRASADAKLSTFAGRTSTTDPSPSIDTWTTAPG